MCRITVDGANQPGVCSPVSFFDNVDELPRFFRGGSGKDCSDVIFIIPAYLVALPCPSGDIRSQTRKLRNVGLISVVAPEYHKGKCLPCTLRTGSHLFKNNAESVVRINAIRLILPVLSTEKINYVIQLLIHF